MDGFNALLLEGDFYEEEGKLWMTEHGNAHDVDEVLRPFEGQQVHIAVHMLPPMPPDPSKRGGGCCHWPEGSECPAGHHDDPLRLLNVHGDGTLIYKEGDWRTEATWWLRLFDGTEKRLPLMYLPGHDARIACTTKFDAERMASILEDKNVEALGTQAEHLQDILQQLQKVTKEH